MTPLAEGWVNTDSVSYWKAPLPLLTQAIRLIPILFLSIVVLACALLVTNARMPDPKVVRPLPDIGFDIFPKVGWLEKMTDVCIGILNAMSIFVLFKLYLIHRQAIGSGELPLPCKIPFISTFLFSPWDNGAYMNMERRDIHLIAWIRFLSTYSIVMIYRAIVIVMTSYPATDNHCQNPVPITNPFKNVILTVVTFGSGSIHCGDLMFSGHTIMITLSLMIHWIYGTILHWVLRPISLLIVLCSFYSIIASRSHYTDDIVVSLYVTAVTFIAIGHTNDGAPWQLQLLIRWWPCCGANKRVEENYAGEANRVSVEVHFTEEKVNGETKEIEVHIQDDYNAANTTNGASREGVFASSK